MTLKRDESKNIKELTKKKKQHLLQTQQLHGTRYGKWIIEFQIFLAIFLM
jgi:hypothetical protein